MQQWIIYLNHSLCDSIIALSHIVISVLFRWIVQADTGHVREFFLIIEVNTTAVFCLYSMITSVSCVWFQTLMSVKPALITAELSWSVRTQPDRSAAVPECCGAGFIQDALGSRIGETETSRRTQLCVQHQSHDAPLVCDRCQRVLERDEAVSSGAHVLQHGRLLHLPETLSDLWTGIPSEPRRDALHGYTNKSQSPA